MNQDSCKSTKVLKISILNINGVKIQALKVSVGNKYVNIHEAGTSYGKCNSIACKHVIQTVAFDFDGSNTCEK